MNNTNSNHENPISSVHIELANPVAQNSNTPTSSPK